jgi:CDP-diacylglycerol---glycerol-3-phosphate 3-phosphatidyltransferase
MNLANKITLVRIFLVPIFMLFVTPMPEWMTNKSSLFHTISKYSLWIATAIFILAAITDKLDGYIARKYNQVTKFGSLVDPLADKLMVISALLFLVQQNKVAGWIAIIIVSREIAVTALRIAAAYNKKVLAADKYGKIKLVFQVIAIPLCLLNNYPLNLIIHFPFDRVMMLFTVLITAFSGVNYFIKNKDVFYENGQLVI